MSLTKPFAALGLLLFAVSSTWAAPQARIMRSIDSRQMTQLPNGVHPLAQPEFDQGALDPSQMLTHVTMFFSRTTAQQQALDQLLQEQQDPASPKYHQWLTPEEYAAQFGMAPSDLAKVRQWLESQGFTVESVARGGDFISFSGSVGEINSAFRTEMHQYNVNGELHFANAIEPAVPNAISGVVVGFRGLNDFKPRARVKTRKVNPRLTSGLSGNHFMVPDDFQTIYNLKSVYSNLALDGTGQSIAVIGQVGASQTLLNDVATFRSLSGLPATTVQVVGSSTGNNSGDLGESALDLEWAGATAPGAKLLFVTSGDAFTSLTNAIDSNVAPVISISYGLCEKDEGSSFGADESTMAKAASQGQSVIGPSGDNGGADCDYSSTTTITTATKGLYVDYPASSQYVTGIGGTTFSDASGTFWSTTNNSMNGSALGYIPEAVWNDTSSTIGLSATGGGASVLPMGSPLPKPSWQTGAGVPNDGVRDVPDVSFAASPGHDEYITCSQGSCQVCYPGSAIDPSDTVTPPGTGAPDANCPSKGSPGFRSSSDNTFNVVGGTSAGVPTFAGVVALLNEKIGSSQGFLNTKLYQLAVTAPYVYHDITSGDNIVPCTPGTPLTAPPAQQCPNTPTVTCPPGATSCFGYTATPGYDQTTGLGSVDAYNLITNWNSAGSQDFAVNFFDSKLSLTRGSSTTIPLTLQPLNGFSGTVSLSCASSITGVTCSVPSTATPGSAVTVTVTAAANVSQERHAPSPFVPYWQYSFGLAAVFMMGKKRSKRQIAAIVVIAVVLIVAMPSCGGGGGGGGSNSNVVTTPNLALTPSSLTFNAQTAGSAPAAQTIAVSSTGSALNYTVTTSTNSGGNWLSATPASGTSGSSVSVSVNPSGLSAGTYTGSVSIAASGAGNSPQTATVTLNVTNAAVTGNITVTATSGALTHTSQIAVTVN